MKKLKRSHLNYWSNSVCEDLLFTKENRFLPTDGKALCDLLTFLDDSRIEVVLKNDEMLLYVNGQLNTQKVPTNVVDIYSLSAWIKQNVKQKLQMI